jgi:hypothetical protein
MTIYPASKVRHLPMWKALTAAGVPIRASWLDAPFNTTGEEPLPESWATHWSRCCDEAAAADIVLFYAKADEYQMGALIEAGAALGAGKQVWCISPHRWSFRHHPRCRNFESLDQAIAELATKRVVRGFDK